MRNTEMINGLIISDYDSNYELSMRLEGLDLPDDHEIVKNYKYSRLETFLKWFHEYYEKDVLLCVDGCIEFYPVWLHGKDYFEDD